MSIEQHAVSHELAKKMEEMGFSQESIYAYYREGHHWAAGVEVEPSQPTIEQNVGRDVSFPYEFVASAYLASELGEIIGTKFGVKVFRNSKKWCCLPMDDHHLYDLSKYEKTQQYWAGSIPDAMALLLIWLVENGYLDVNSLKSL